jgi:hypothetical protein
MSIVRMTGWIVGAFALTMTATTAVQAHDGDGEWHRHHHKFRDRYYVVEPVQVVRPSVVYVRQPPVVYAPPPVTYVEPVYAAPVYRSAPSLNINIPLR